MLVLTRDVGTMHKLAEEITTHPRFARAAVNRVWAQLFVDTESKDGIVHA